MPDAHVEAPTAGSVILAGVLLKMGGYGFLRFSLPMFPEATRIFYADGVLAQRDCDYLHLACCACAGRYEEADCLFFCGAYGVCDAWDFYGDDARVEGAIFQMLSHGLISGALFLCVGVVYDRLHTREIARYGGIVKNMPKYATVFMIFMLGSVGLPGTSGFVGEFLCCSARSRSIRLIAALAATGVILGAAYMLVALSPCGVWAARRIKMRLNAGFE